MSPIRQILRSDYFVVSAAFVSIIAAAIETDIFLPSMPGMQDYFGTTPAKIQMLISFNFLGLCLSALFFGPLSDAYGRRKLLLIGLSIFCTGGIGCLVSTDINWFLFWRFIQGLGASACFVIPSAIIYDIFSREKAAAVLGYYNSVVTIVMATAPMIGSYLYIHFSWHANFYFMMATSALAWLCTLFFVPETLSASSRQPLLLNQILKGFVKVITNKRTLAPLVLFSTGFGAYFVYLGNLSLIFVDELGVPDEVFPWYQGSIVLTFSLINLWLGRLIARFGEKNIEKSGRSACGVGAVLMLIVSLLLPENPLLITLAMMVFITGLALFLNIAYSQMMTVFPEIKGISASLATAIRLLLVVGGVSLSGLVYNGTMTPVGILVFTLSIGGLLINRHLWRSC